MKKRRWSEAAGNPFYRIEWEKFQLNDKNKRVFCHRYFPIHLIMTGSGFAKEIAP